MSDPIPEFTPDQREIQSSSSQEGLGGPETPPIPLQTPPMSPPPDDLGPPRPSERAAYPPGPSGPYQTIPPTSNPSQFSSNYPRSGLNMFGYIRPPGVYWDSIGTGWTMVTANLGVYVLASLIFLIGMGVVYVAYMGLLFSMVMGTKNLATQSIFMILPNSAIQVVGAFFVFCMISVGVRHAQGYQPKISDFFIPFNRLKASAPASVLVAAPMIVLSVLQGGFQLAVRSNQTLGVVLVAFFALLWIPIYVGWYGPMVLGGTAAIFGERSSIQAARTTYDRLKWHSLLFGLLVFVSGMVSGLGAMAVCIGFLFTFPISTNVFALHYFYNFPEDQPGYKPDVAAV